MLVSVQKVNKTRMIGIVSVDSQRYASSASEGLLLEKNRSFRLPVGVTGSCIGVGGVE